MEFIATLLKILGLGADAVGVNKTLGVFNYAALVPVLVWLYRHHSEQISFSLDLGTLAAILLCVFVWLEFNRRA
jgi:hypothetical protein